MDKKYIISIIIVILIAVAFGAMLLQNKTQEGEPVVVGGDTDQHGCISSAGYSWCKTTNKCFRAFEEFCLDAVSNLVGLIKKDTEILLASPEEATFRWFVGQDSKIADTDIAGIKYSVQGIKMADYQKIEGYMNNTYGVDNYNVADGVTGGLRGYYLNYMACNLNFQHDKIKETEEGPLEPDGDSLNVSLSCGYFNKNGISRIMDNYEIRRVLADKYHKSIMDVKINITKSDETHALGIVSFGEGGAGESGMFLAVKIADLWQIVFDGNGAVDCGKMRDDYGFSDEILTPNLCDY